MRWTAVALLSLLVATCGQKGPLSLPEEEAEALAPCQPAIYARGAPVVGVAPAPVRRRTFTTGC